MPYKNIVFVKLEKRLLNDPRWWTMSDEAQLIYVKLILLAAETYNKIPLNDNVLREALRSRLELKSFQKCLKEIEQNFPKLRKNKHFRYFGEFETKTNYIPKREIPRKSQVLPKVGADKEEDKDIDKEEDKEKKPPQDFITTLKTNLAYKHIDIDNELAKMDVWLLVHKDRKKTQRFVVNWLNKADRPVGVVDNFKPKPNPNHDVCGGTGYVEQAGKKVKCFCW